jgi:hypothetical protein
MTMLSLAQIAPTVPAPACIPNTKGCAMCSNTTMCDEKSCWNGYSTVCVKYFLELFGVYMCMCVCVRVRVYVFIGLYLSTRRSF